MPAPNPLKSIEPEMPELYIDTTLRQGLNEVLPQALRKGLDFGASYDLYIGLAHNAIRLFPSDKGME